MDLASGTEGLELHVDVVEELGADAYIYGTPSGVQQLDTDGEGGNKPFLARVDGRRPPKRGETVRLVPKPGHSHIFNADSGVRLGK
jgi:multiple sugar transport system ATP-binding protein